MMPDDVECDEVDTGSVTSVNVTGSRLHDDVPRKLTPGQPHWKGNSLKQLRTRRTLKKLVVMTLAAGVLAVAGASSAQAATIHNSSGTHGSIKTIVGAVYCGSTSITVRTNDGMTLHTPHFGGQNAYGYVYFFKYENGRWVHRATAPTLSTTVHDNWAVTNRFPSNRSLSGMRGYWKVQLDIDWYSVWTNAYQGTFTANFAYGEDYAGPNRGPGYCYYP